LDRNLLIPMVTPKDCVLVFDLIHDSNQECDCIVISNPPTAGQGYLIDCYSEEEEKLLDRFAYSDFSAGYLMESVYEMPQDIDKQDIIDGLVSMGFGYIPGFLKDSKSI